LTKSVNEVEMAPLFSPI